jgi:hypothetical protein
MIERIIAENAKLFCSLTFSSKPNGPSGSDTSRYGCPSAIWLTIVQIAGLERRNTSRERDSSASYVHLPNQIGRMLHLTGRTHLIHHRVFSVLVGMTIRLRSL